MLRGLFGNGRQAREREAGVSDRIKGWARDMPGLQGAEMTVSEIECLDPACPGIETVLLVMRPGERTRAVKLPCAMAEVTQADLRSALAEASAG